MRHILSVAVVAALTLVPFKVCAEEGAVFLRDAFTGEPHAGYRWSNGFSVSGRYAHRSLDTTFGSSSSSHLMVFGGYRSLLSEDDKWRSFWEVDLGLGSVSQPDDTLRMMELGGWLGAEAFIVPRLSIAGRVGIVYSKEDVNATVTSTEIEVGRAQVELTYYW